MIIVLYNHTNHSKYGGDLLNGSMDVSNVREVSCTTQEELQSWFGLLGYHLWSAGAYKYLF